MIPFMPSYCTLVYLHLRQAFLYYFHPTKAKFQCLPLCHVSFYHLLEPALLITMPPNFHSDHLGLQRLLIQQIPLDLDISWSLINVDNLFQYVVKSCF